MQQKCVFGVAICILALLVISPLACAQDPGTPLYGGNFGTIDLYTGLTLLPTQVVPGDVALLEDPNGGPASSNWSDLARFFNLNVNLIDPLNPGGPNISTTFGAVFLVPDSDPTGIPDITVNFLSGNITNAALPNVLHPNQRFLTEIQIGTGTDADITQYNIAGNSAIYNIHSDAAQEGGPAETTIMPGAPVGDPLINGVFFIDEAGNTSGNGRPGIDFKSGSNDVPAAAGEGWSDTLNWDANTGVLTWTSDGGPDNADDQEFEVYNGVNGGEHVIAWVIGGYDVPEPSSLILLSIGAITLLAYAWRKRSRTA